jgi:hypothetical protein
MTIQEDGHLNTTIRIAKIAFGCCRREVASDQDADIRTQEIEFFCAQGDQCPSKRGDELYSLLVKVSKNKA